MRNRTYGGVRGRKTKVGRKLLRFPPTRLILKQKKLFLSALVSLIEFVDTTCCIHELYLSGIEWVRGV